jgi:hypothetical protein
MNILPQELVKYITQVAVNVIASDGIREKADIPKARRKIAQITLILEKRTKKRKRRVKNDSLSSVSAVSN